MSKYVKNPKSIEKNFINVERGIEPGPLNIIAAGKGVGKPAAKFVEEVNKIKPKARRRRCAICNELKENKELKRLTDKKTRKLRLVCIDCKK